MNPLFTPKGPIYKNEDDKLRLETRNGVIQAEFVFHTASNWQPDSKFNPELLKELQRLAVNQVYRCAGEFRDAEVKILGGSHKPPEAPLVIALVDEMCAYINDNWEKTAVHLAAYAMWRVNWIHPFFGGNGRASRAASYLALSARLGFAIPGVKTIPALIVDNRTPYYAALRKADAAWQSEQLDLSDMETFLSDLLAKQLYDLHKLATETNSKVPSPPVP